MKNVISYVELQRWSIWFKTRNPIPQLIKGTKFLSKYLRRERMRIICCRAAPSCYRCACRAARVRNSLRCCASLLKSISYFVFHISLSKSILRGTVFRSRCVFVYCFAINLFWLNYLINFWQQCEIGLEILITGDLESA